MEPEWDTYSYTSPGGSSGPTYPPLHAQPHNHHQYHEQQQQQQLPIGEPDFIDSALMYLPVTTSSVSDSYFPTADYSSISQTQGLLSPVYSPYSGSYAASTSSQHSSYSNYSHQRGATPSPYPSSHDSHSHSHHAGHRASTSPYPPSASHSPSFAYTPSPYATSPNDTPSPVSYADSSSTVDPDIINCFFPEGAGSGSATHVHPSSSSSNTTATSFACDYPSCTKSYPRLCDLRKHKKRHLKPFPCPEAACDSFFSTEKDRDRHTKSKHRREEHLVCAVCGHRTARKDNMRDHIKRRHGEDVVERIMNAVMAASGSSSGGG
ncbi:hypothetical protein BZA05DRAFT_419405 [Tricharina praecox]|uniref:uncharacterized protein n=1 Tax=Tricharina praecox TaxID=43433 RepID=UPI00221EB07C|nr:uncharacterized protein BZA05DRAFT_419405 [Tricharina praecox]KAI5850021.1 hypothetical protein BZA05DRAFT_419405 [Tricharina praecox]